MRLRNLFMILLLCMTVGVFSACTGDDGAQGPPGPQGPQGEPGETVDAADVEATSFYDFVKSWGSTSGEIGCSDSLLKGMGPLPGPELEDILFRTDQANTPNVNEGNINSPVGVVCTNGTWGDIENVKIGKTTQSVAEIVAGTRDPNIVLWKTGRAVEEHEGDPTLSPKNDFGLATATTTTKYFVGGTIFANLPNTGGDEAFERASLHTQCGVGTSPPNIMGTWKAVKVSDAITTFEDSSPRDSNNDGTPDAPTVVMSLLKICVVLDAHPGVTKCYVNSVNRDLTTRSMSVNLYTADGLVTPPVVGMKKLPGNDTTTNQEEFLFDDGPTTTNDAEDFGDVENLCALFDSGVPQ